MLVLLLKLYLFFKFTLSSNAKNTVKTLFQDYIFIFVTVYAIIDIIELRYLVSTANDRTHNPAVVVTRKSPMDKKGEGG